jgi:hypothetical protein
MLIGVDGMKALAACSRSMCGGGRMCCRYISRSIFLSQFLSLSRSIFLSQFLSLHRP